MAQQNINTGTIPNDKTGDSLRTAMIKVQNNFTELYTTAPISNSINIGNTTSNVLANSTTVFIGNSSNYSIANSSSIITNIGYHSQVLNSGANNLVLGTTNATSIFLYTNGITAANLRAVIVANGNFGIGNSSPNELLTVGGTMSANQVIVGNTTVNFTINATFIPVTANYALSSNSTNFIGTLAAANVVSNSQLQANLSNYTNTAGLTSYVAGATSNNTSFVGTVSAANVVSNSQLQANISALSSTYQTMAGLSANVATLTANNTSFVGSVTAANVVSNAQLSANLSNYQTTAGFNANVASYLPTYTGVINASSYTIGSSFIANSVGVTTSGYANISGQIVMGTTANLVPGAVSYINGGFSVISYSIGNILTGTISLNPSNGNYQYYTNNGAHTVSAPSKDCAIDILITNGSTAGSITFSGFTAPSGGGGDAFVTTNTYQFLLMVRRINGVSTYAFKALQ